LDGKPLLGRITLDKNGPGSVELVLSASSADAPKFTGNYTVKNDEMTMSIKGSSNPRTGAPAQMTITFTRQGERKSAK
jgi:hypothetical protein